MRRGSGAVVLVTSFLLYPFEYDFSDCHESMLLLTHTSRVLARILDHLREVYEQTDVIEEKKRGRFCWNGEGPSIIFVSFEMRPFYFIFRYRVAISPPFVKLPVSS